MYRKFFILHLKMGVITAKINRYEYHLFNEILLLGQNFIFFSFSFKFYAVSLKNKEAMVIQNSKSGLQNIEYVLCTNFIFHYRSNCLVSSVQILPDMFCYKG